MNQIPNREEWKKLAKKILAPNVTYIDPKFKEVASWAEELLNAFWVEQQKDLDAFIDTIHQQLQKAREVEGGIEEWKKRAKRYRDTLYIKQHMLYIGEKQDYGELCEAMRNACDAIDALIENTDHQLQKAKKQQQEV